MKQKRNSHIRKSNYHPPKIQTEKPVQNSASAKKEAQGILLQKRKSLRLHY